MNYNNKLLKKFLSFSMGGYIGLAIGFFTTPIVTRMLSPEQYGISSIFSLVINILSLIVIFGMDQGFVRYFYEEKSKSGLLYSVLKYPLILFGVLSIALYFFKEKIGNLIYGEYDFSMFIVIIVMLFFTVINRFSFLLVRMEQKAKLYSFFQIISQLLNFILILIFFKLYGNNYKTLVISSMVALMICTILSMITEKKVWRFKEKKIGISVNELIKYSIPFSLTMALTWIFQGADKIAIKSYSDMNELGLYAAAFKIIALMNIVKNGFSTFWVPVAYEKYQKNPEEKKFFEDIHDYISLAMLLSGVFLLLSKNFIVLILGDKFRDAAGIMPMLIMMPLMYTVSETTVLGINFKKKTNYHLTISIGAAIANIIGNMLLVPRFGAKGAAISTGIAYILFFILRTYYSQKCVYFNFNLKRFYFLTSLLFIYALYLTFYSNLKITIISAIGITVIILWSYNKILINILKK